MRLVRVITESGIYNGMKKTTVKELRVVGQNSEKGYLVVIDDKSGDTYRIKYSKDEHCWVAIS